MFEPIGRKSLFGLFHLLVANRSRSSTISSWDAVTCCELSCFSFSLR